MISVLGETVENIWKYRNITFVNNNEPDYFSIVITFLIK